MARTGGPWQTWRGSQIDRLLRPDVRLYPGQSGSALVNGRGELIGINSSVLARESVITVPPETIDRVVNELSERGHIAHPYLGIAMQEVSLPQEWRSGGYEQGGLLVMHVAPDTPAKQSGIGLGDLIVGVDSQNVQSIRQFHRVLTQKRVGDTLDLSIIRGGNTIAAKVTLGDRPRR
jgi:S1-C subfamily serine protease